jgi:transposase InsO family protein
MSAMRSLSTVITDTLSPKRAGVKDALAIRYQRWMPRKRAKHTKDLRNGEETTRASGARVVGRRWRRGGLNRSGERAQPVWLPLSRLAGTAWLFFSALNSSVASV